MHAELPQQLLLPLDTVLSQAPADESVHIAYKPPLATPAATREELREVYTDLFGVAMCSAVSVQPWDGEFAGRTPERAWPQTAERSGDGEDDRHFAFARPEDASSTPAGSGREAPPASTARTLPSGGPPHPDEALAPSETSPPDRGGDAESDDGTEEGDTDTAKQPRAPAQGSALAPAAATPDGKSASASAEQSMGTGDADGPSSDSHHTSDTTATPPGGAANNADAPAATSGDRAASSPRATGIDLRDRSGQEDEFDAADYDEGSTNRDRSEASPSPAVPGDLNKARGAADHDASRGGAPNTDQGVAPTGDDTPVLLLLPGAVPNGPRATSAALFVRRLLRFRLRRRRERLATVPAAHALEQTLDAPPQVALRCPCCMKRPHLKARRVQPSRWPFAGLGEDVPVGAALEAYLTPNDAFGAAADAAATVSVVHCVLAEVQLRLAADADVAAGALSAAVEVAVAAELDSLLPVNASVDVLSVHFGDPAVAAGDVAGHAPAPAQLAPTTEVALDAEDPNGSSTTKAPAEVSDAQQAEGPASEDVTGADDYGVVTGAAEDASDAETPSTRKAAREDDGGQADDAPLDRDQKRSPPATAPAAALSLPTPPAPATNAWERAPPVQSWKDVAQVPRSAPQQQQSPSPMSRRRSGRDSVLPDDRDFSRASRSQGAAAERPQGAPERQQRRGRTPSDYSDDRGFKRARTLQATQADAAPLSAGASTATIAILVADIESGDVPAVAIRLERRSVLRRIVRAANAKLPAGTITHAAARAVVRSTLLSVAMSDFVREQSRHDGWQETVARATGASGVQEPERVWQLTESNNGHMRGEVTDMGDIGTGVSAAAFTKQHTLILAVTLAFVALLVAAMWFCAAWRGRRRKADWSAKGGYSAPHNGRRGPGQALGESVAASLPSLGFMSPQGRGGAAERSSLPGASSGRFSTVSTWLEAPAAHHRPSDAPVLRAECEPRRSSSAEVALGVVSCMSAEGGTTQTSGGGSESDAAAAAAAAAAVSMSDGDAAGEGGGQPHKRWSRVVSIMALLPKRASVVGAPRCVLLVYLLVHILAYPSQQRAVVVFLVASDWRQVVRVLYL